MRFHSTGMNSDPKSVAEVYDRLNQMASVEGRSILEIGPGQTVELLEQALRDGASQCSAVDIVRYLPSGRYDAAGVDFRLYDGRNLPFGDGIFDLIWAYDVFEHLRYPEITVRESYRVLKPGGILIGQIDLGDHYSYRHKDRTRLFECLKYSRWMWNLMTWNRSAYVNRLRYGEWKRIFLNVGFQSEMVDRYAEPIIEEMRERGEPKYLMEYNREDAVTACMMIMARKPAVDASAIESPRSI